MGKLPNAEKAIRKITERWISFHPRNDDGDIELAAFGSLVDAIRDGLDDHARAVLEAAAQAALDHPEAPAAAILNLKEEL